MSEPDQTARDGSCMCGAVRFEVAVADPRAHVCHCGMCRKWGAGGPAITVDCGDLRFADETGLSWYKSSEWAERGFCRRCGSSLFYRMEHESGTYMNVTVSALEQADDITISDHIFIDCKPPYYDFADDCPRLTEKETFEKFEKELSS